jgi:hypothetical protein
MTQPDRSDSKLWEALRLLRETSAALMRTLDAHEERIRQLEQRSDSSASGEKLLPVKES